MIKIVIEEELNNGYARINFAKILAHVCRGNSIASKKVLKILLTLINKAEKSKIVDLIRLVAP